MGSVRVLGAAVLLGACVVAAGLLIARGEPATVASGVAIVDDDPFAYEQDRSEEFLERGSRGFSHVLYRLSPGGVEASAARTARFEDEIAAAAGEEGLEPSTLEALVLLESAGRPDVIAGPTPESASGLAQILPGTAAELLGMSVDLERSSQLTKQIERAGGRVTRRGREGRRARSKLRRLIAERRRVDERFDPRAALAGAARYLALASQRFGREDLAVASYHMGIGNLQSLIETYLAPEPVSGGTRAAVEENELTYPQLFFDTSPLRNPRAYRQLRGFGDDSASYLFRVEAAREVMRLFRDDLDGLRRLAELHANKASAEEVLRPPDRTEQFADADALREAYEDGDLVRLENDPRRLGYSVDRQMGELAERLDGERRLYRGLRPEALATVVYTARRVRRITGEPTTLRLTSTVRDAPYQGLLRERNAQATDGYSLHRTGYAFDIARDLDDSEEEALVAELERLQALAVIDWVYEPGAIHVAVGPDAEELLADRGLF
jgi:Transglycosylase SLT domain